MSTTEIKIPSEVEKLIEDQIEAYPLTQEDRELHRTKLKLFAEFGYRLAASQSLSTQPVTEDEAVSKAWTYLAKKGTVETGIEYGSCFRAHDVLRALKIAASLPIPQVTEDEIEKRILAAYYAGFNQSHYSHVHPETFPPKTCEYAGAQYWDENKKYILAGYKAAHQEKGDNCVASQSTTSEPVASHSCADGNSIEQ